MNRTLSRELFLVDEDVAFARGGEKRSVSAKKKSRHV